MFYLKLKSQESIFYVKTQTNIPETYKVRK